VSEKHAEEGVEILIRIGDKDWPAVVTTEPIYDPEGARLRS
jgi:glycine cleavage system aminomethyltransferase T